MFTKLAPHEDVGENVTFMARFIILPTQRCYAALLRKLSSTKAAAATARPEVRSSRLYMEYAKILHACVFFPFSFFFCKQRTTNAKMRNIILSEYELEANSCETLAKRDL